MRVYKASRRELYERIDRPALTPLPATAFVYGEWKHARVNIDYHVELDGHYYSVPHALIHEQVELRSTATTVEAFYRGKRVASHARSNERGRHTTVDEHMPVAHREHRGLVAVAASSPGPARSGRSTRRARRRRSWRERHAPRAGLPLVPRDLAARQAIQPRATRSGDDESARGRRALVPARRRDLEARPRSRRARGARRRDRPSRRATRNVRGRDYYN